MRSCAAKPPSSAAGWQRAKRSTTSWSKPLPSAARRAAASSACGITTCSCIGGMILHEGNIAEMVTGEGKTLVATLPAYLNAIEGKGVHVVTVNDYLARRDMEWMGPLYTGLGLTVGAIQSGMDSGERQKVVRLRHHLRHEQRIRLRLPPRQHADRRPRR